MSREEKVRRALGKPARYGPDLDLKAYMREAREWPTTSIEELPGEVTGRASEVGVDGSGSGVYFQVDRSVVYRAVERMYEGKVEVLSVREAFEKYDWVEKLFWKLVEPDTDKYTALAYLEPDEGYFIRIRRGAKVERPIQTCMFVSTDRLDQNVHNLIVAEEGSEAHIVTGCTLHPTVRSGLHVGVSEFYVKRGAKLTFSMVHAWAEGFDVITATDGEEALAKAQREKPDLIVMDVMMPRLDGYETCRRLKSDPSTKDIPVLLLTARGREEDRRLGLESGANDYITKPFSPNKLIGRVSDLLGIKH